jgi:hypothetical protein
MPRKACAVSNFPYPIPVEALRSKSSVDENNERDQCFVRQLRCSSAIDAQMRDSFRRVRPKFFRAIAVDWPRNPFPIK